MTRSAPGLALRGTAGERVGEIALMAKPRKWAQAGAAGRGWGSQAKGCAHGPGGRAEVEARLEVLGHGRRPLALPGGLTTARSWIPPRPATPGASRPAGAGPPRG